MAQRRRTTTPKTKPSGGQAGIAPKGTATTPVVDRTQRRKPTVSSGTPPRGRKTTGTPKSRRPVESSALDRPESKPPVVASRRQKPNPPKKLTASRRARSPFVFEYK